MGLKNKSLMGGWLSTAARVFRSDKNMKIWPFDLKIGCIKSAG